MHPSLAWPTGFSFSSWECGSYALAPNISCKRHTQVGREFCCLRCNPLIWWKVLYLSRFSKFLSPRTALNRMHALSKWLSKIKTIQSLIIMVADADASNFVVFNKYWPVRAIDSFVYMTTSSNMAFGYNSQNPIPVPIFSPAFLSLIVLSLGSQFMWKRTNRASKAK